MSGAVRGSDADHLGERVSRITGVAPGVHPLEILVEPVLAHLRLEALRHLDISIQAPFGFHSSSMSCIPVLLALDPR